MNEHAGQNRSIWMATEAVDQFPELKENAQADVCIIGAGITGISTAYRLLSEGKSVIILDDGPIASGETERTTAHLSNAFDDRYYNIERMHGERAAQLLADSHTTAIARIEGNILEEKIDCDFTRLDGFLFVPPGVSTAALEEELKAVHRAGLMEVEWVDRAPLESFDTGPCLRFPRQGQFHITKYLNGLVQAIVRRGGKIYCHTRAQEFNDGTPCEIITASGKTIRCDAIVVATGTPVNDRVVMHTKQAAYRTYVIAARIPKDSVRRALYWDTMIPYHYVRTQPAAHGEPYDTLIVGGEDHKTGQPGEMLQEGDQFHEGHKSDDFPAPFMNLEKWARERFPMMEEIEFRWSGQVFEPVDHIAFIGKNPGSDRIYICTGDSGQGITHGTIASILITDQICERPNEWVTLYDPARKTLKSASQFTRENLNVARCYLEWLKPGEVASVEDVSRGKGAIIRRGLTRVAVYRDESGTLHERSAACPHLGCIVNWNNVEKTWDCPCHGSRFDCHGTVVNGPSLSDLPPVESKKMEPVHH